MNKSKLLAKFLEILFGIDERTDELYGDGETLDQLIDFFLSDVLGLSKTEADAVLLVYRNLSQQEIANRKSAK